jgi:hypothetical protein
VKQEFIVEMIGNRYKLCFTVFSEFEIQSECGKLKGVFKQNIVLYFCFEFYLLALEHFIHLSLNALGQFQRVFFNFD